MGVIEHDQISAMDMLEVAKMWMRFQRLREEIDVLRIASRARKRRQHEVWLRLG
jgi:hypothetical protein